MKLFNKRPHMPPVEKIEVTGKHFNVRVVLLAVFVAVALVGIGFGIYYAVSREPGWTTVSVTTKGPSCVDDFVLSYNIGTTKQGATAEYKALELAYAQAALDAYRVFNAEAKDSELAKVSRHPNETVKVDKSLYQAFQLLERYGNRCIYLAPVYVEYGRVFSAEDAVSAQRYDPNLDEEARGYVNQIAAFVNDPQMIGLELLEDSQVRLQVHGDYLAFAQENEITDFLDFGWMKNAFIADYLAQTLEKQGFTNGYLASYDGFTRVLDDSDTVFSLNLFNREGNDIYHPAVLDYTGPMSLVVLRNYPMSNADKWHYYAYTTGHITTAVIDPATGLSCCGVNNLVSYSQSSSCAQILMELAPIFMAEALDESALTALPQKSIDCIWFREGELIATQTDVSIRTVEESK